MKHAREDYNRIQDPAGLIPADEPVFLIRAQDACATWTLEEWIKRARYIKADPAIVSAACVQLDRIYDWQDTHGVKVPDLADASVGVSSRAIADIAIERRRQVEAEGWTPEHDDKYRDGELADAGACYALAAYVPSGLLPGSRLIQDHWPFGFSWWKPGAPRRMLVKAAALIIAEIERLDRKGTQ